MKTLFIGQNLIYLESVDSTNNYANELLRKNNVPEGTIVYTFNQLKGRGQRGNLWESKPNNNISLSLVLAPSFLLADKQYLLTKITSLAVTDLLSELLHFEPKLESIKIKWPNDIFINDCKIGGILIENTIRESYLQNSVVGIGININQTEFTFSDKATSLALIAKKQFNLKIIIEKLCSYFEARYLQLKANNIKNIDLEYLQRLYRLNSWNQFVSNEQLFEGRIIGVSDSGKLEVQINSGVVKLFDLKEIKFI